MSHETGGYNSRKHGLLTKQARNQLPRVHCKLDMRESKVLDGRDTTYYHPFSTHLNPNHSGSALLVLEKPHLEQPQQAREAR